ncbi:MULTISPECIES: retropepsin-like aspartic protease [Dyella]|nr:MULTISPECIES: retropepsin-like aspartic protease [Dyella]
MKSMRLATIVACLALAPALHAASAKPIQFQPFMERALIVNATINGHPGTFMFDTGGGISFISPKFAAEIGCKPWGQITGFQMTGNRLDMQRCDNVSVQVDQHQVRRETVGVFDMDKFLPTGSKEKIDGSLALDIFDGQVVKFSYSERTLTVLDQSAVAALSKKTPSVPIHVVREAEGLALAVNLPVKTDNGTAWFELDSGNTSPFILAGKHLADTFKLDNDPRTKQTIKTALADGQPIEGNVKVLDLTLDGNLGMTFLSKYDVTIDMANHRAWVVPSKGSEVASSAKPASE